MTRASMLAAIASIVTLAASSAHAQVAGDVVDVELTKSNYEFIDRYEFQPGGVLLTGGIISSTTVTEYRTEQRTRTEKYNVVRFVNGRLVVEQRERLVEYTVQVPIDRTVEFFLPAVNGIWYGTRNFAIWLISTSGPSGVEVGLGTTVGGSVTGTVTYLNLGGPPPAGTYRVANAPPVIE